jgi:hypothetical protein
MLVFLYVACTAQSVAIGSNAWQYFFRKKSMGCFPALEFFIDIRMNTTFAGKNK